MGFALGQKIDARLKLMEARIKDLETFCKALIQDEGINAKQILERIEALEAKRGPGRPKATDGK